MKKLLIFLFVLALPVSAGNEPPVETGKSVMTHAEIEQTLDQYDRSIKLYNKREWGLAWITSGVSVSGVGVATAMVADLDKGLTLGIAAVGVGLVVTGCYLVFKSNKQLYK